ncbi:MAG: LysM peptidoglycan-binding domain-containing protein [Gammaproteobacteria bacterium]|nr:LysM peptidoglycan-binding domain-containing protein [Gammaproteobacteria bacterium]
MDDIYVERKEGSISLIIETSADVFSALPEVNEPEVLTTAAPVTTTEKTASEKPEPRAKSRTFIHIVKRGDTLWDIAKHYINDPWRYRDLVKQNNIDNPDLIYPGERVNIVFRERK